MAPIAPETLMTFLTRLGERCDRETRLYLLGGSALRLLGSPRETLDVDYIADVPAEITQAFRQALAQPADEARGRTVAVAQIPPVGLPPTANVNTSRTW